MLSVSQLRPSVSRDRFDSHGARKAAIAMLTAIYKTGRHGTLAEVLIAKNRDGPIANVELHYEPEMTWFSNRETTI